MYLQCKVSRNLLIRNIDRVGSQSGLKDQSRPLAPFRSIRSFCTTDACTPCDFLRCVWHTPNAGIKETFPPAAFDTARTIHRLFLHCEGQSPNICRLSREKSVSGLARAPNSAVSSAARSVIKSLTQESKLPIPVTAVIQAGRWPGPWKKLEFRSQDIARAY